MYFKVKGTRDLFEKESLIFEKIRKVFFQKLNSYNSIFIETPIFENYNLFYRTSGEESDIVNKEMYVFKDKSNRQLALRPEGTAPAVRAIIENKLYFKNKKFHYFGPMFRYERPQKGRFRQFYQAGAEFLGEKNVYLDFEIINLAFCFLKELKVDDFTLKINYLGTKEEKKAYINALKKYFQNYKNELSEISLKRLEKNPLRILDDKTEQEKDFVKKAPKIIDFLNQESISYFNDLKLLLNKFQIPFEKDYSLVRGLDYYDEIVFEFVSTSNALGAKSTIIGGGRYNNLFSNLNGPDISAIGFAVGVDRVLEIMKTNSELNFEKKVDYFVAVVNENEYDFLLKVVNELRNLKYNVEFNKKALNLKKLFENARNLNSEFIVFIEKNQTNSELTIKNLKTFDKHIITFNELKKIKGKNENN
ncbi:histidine--tRNA ligase [Mesomycoplasma neurolyticum]|uniref:Histidine--tRNA ligase n=1 Tax=Mesomycoplasma neurolyticum TaxID=2120 RepID=A0A449A6E3_9BACT|nr:histidine--tRNA ligase [Mesomycoplasma neurolyticum]VEU59806.1 histidyl-tRNA synthetase [Mesomycoplasma neurolyticum]